VDRDGSTLRFERLAAGGTIPGGMGGGKVEDDIWIHPELMPHAAEIRAVLAGSRDAMGR
jgi:hypothetical protein